MSTTPAAPCPACGGLDRVALTGLAALPASMISNGRVFGAPLRKTVCRGCGLVAHDPSLTLTEVRRFYDQDYELGLEQDASGPKRGALYGGIIAGLAAAQGPAPRRVLEVGCGAGHTLAHLCETGTHEALHGCEAAARLATLSRPGVVIEHGFAEDLPTPATPYDLVFSINVVEHALDPVQFLAALARQTRPGGLIITICPRAAPPNLELLFRDHIHSFTAAAFQALAAKAGLSLVDHRPSLDGAGDFQAFVTRAAPDAAAPSADHAADIGAYRAYAAAWAGLDDALADRLPAGEVFVFGAGEAALLLRAYAPALWSQVAALVVDDPHGARAFDRPIRAFADLAPSAAPLALGVHPRSQRGLAERLTAAGWRVARFDDLIPR